MSSLKWNKLGNARKAGAGNHSSKVLCRQLLLSAALLQGHSGAECWPHTLGSTSVPALLSAVLHSAGTGQGTARTQVPLWPWCQAPAGPQLCTSQKRTHCCFPMGKAQSPSVQDQMPAGLRHCQHHSAFPSQQQFPPVETAGGSPQDSGTSWPWQRQPAVALGQGGLDVQEQLPRDPGQSFISPWVHSGWEKPEGTGEKRPSSSCWPEEQQGLGEGSDGG